jgi:metal-dependent HD superfamily phosphatase/phosphodiesterase
MNVTFEQIKNNVDIKTYITKADESLKALGYTEHSFAHVGKVSHDAAYILETLGYDERTVELAKIAGYLHDIGNLVNRVDHSQSGAVMAFRVLDKLGMSADEIATVVTAIGNHDEGTGVPVNAVAAALIIADKSDVRRTRVRNSHPESFDIHDRVNYSVVDSSLTVTPDKSRIILELTIDSEISAVMDYFQIFLGRMQMTKSAASALKLNFSLVINGQKLL